MKYDQVRITTDLLLAAQLEHYYDLLRVAERERLLRSAQPVNPVAGPAAGNVWQRLRQWISTPAAGQLANTEWKRA